MSKPYNKILVIIKLQIKKIIILISQFKIFKKATLTNKSA